MKMLIKCALLLFLISFIPSTAMAKDTTYVCSEVGDWDRWGVSTAIQEDLVEKDIVYEIRETDKYNFVICYYAYDSQNYFYVCKTYPHCYDLCGDDCDCETCAFPPSPGGNGNIRKHCEKVAYEY